MAYTVSEKIKMITYNKNTFDYLICNNKPGNQKKMRVLVACECSQNVCLAFREKGHIAYSCDILDCYGGFPQFHIKQDVLSLLNGNCSFYTCDGAYHEIRGKWDLIIAHPPCTYLCLSAQRWLYTSNESYNFSKWLSQQDAIDFFMSFVNCNCDCVVIENPVGIMSTIYRKPDLIYNPYDFIGETEIKRTCLWLKGVPPLFSNRSVEIPVSSRTRNMDKGIKNGKQLSWGSLELSQYRSETPPGVAYAFAECWG